MLATIASEVIGLVALVFDLPFFMVCLYLSVFGSLDIEVAEWSASICAPLSRSVSADASTKFAAPIENPRGHFTNDIFQVGGVAERFCKTTRNAL